MSQSWSRRLRSEAGLGQLALIIIIIVIVLLLLLFGACYYSLQNRGGTPNTILIPSTTLAPGVPTTLTIQMPLNHPLPTGSGVMTFTVRIDEDDVWDDTLAGTVTLRFDPQDTAHPYAHGTITVVCNNLGANGEFDLQGPDGTSYGESTHQVHGEQTGTVLGVSGGNASITCVVPTIPVDDSGSSVAGSSYCLYKVDSAPGADAAHINNTVCVRCVPPETNCPTTATLDLGEGRKWQVTSEGQNCQACPAGAKAFEKR